MTLTPRHQQSLIFLHPTVEEKMQLHENTLVKGQILNFLVNVFPPKAFDVVTSNSVGA